MSKNTNFFGQSVFGQLISYIDNNIIYKNAQNHKANHYIKRFMAKDHLISMLFVCLPNVVHLGKFPEQC